MAPPSARRSPRVTAPSEASDKIRWAGRALGESWARWVRNGRTGRGLGIGLGENTGSLADPGFPRHRALRAASGVRGGCGWLWLSKLSMGADRVRMCDHGCDVEWVGVGGVVGVVGVWGWEEEKGSVHCALGLRVGTVGSRHRTLAPRVFFTQRWRLLRGWWALARACSVGFLVFSSRLRARVHRTTRTNHTTTPPCGTKPDAGPALGCTQLGWGSLRRDAPGFGSNQSIRLDQSFHDPSAASLSASSDSTSRSRTPSTSGNAHPNARQIFR